MASQDITSSSGVGMNYITELNSSDVLFGRGSGPNDHEGNIRFRQLVAERKAEYLATNHRQTKAKIAREIVSIVLSENGRFLKKVEHFEARRLGIPKGLDAWITVDDDTIMEKAKQALRQNTNKNKAADPKADHKEAPAARKVSNGFEDLEPLPLGSAYGSGGAKQASSGQTQRAGRDGQLGGWNQEGGADPTPIGFGNRIEPTPLGWETDAVAMPPPARREPSSNLMEPTPLQWNPRHSAPPQTVPSMMPVESLRRSSMNMEDLMKKSIQMDDLIDSFNAMKSKDGENFAAEAKLHESAETMGTIEPIGHESNAAMSVTSFSSSTFSIFKGAMESVEDMPLSRGVSRQSSSDGIRVDSALLGQDSSMSQMWNRRASLLERLISEERAESDANLADNPRPLGLMEEEPDGLTALGRSSMSIMKAALGSSRMESGRMESGQIKPEDRK